MNASNIVPFRDQWDELQHKVEKRLRRNGYPEGLRQFIAKHVRQVCELTAQKCNDACGQTLTLSDPRLNGLSSEQLQAIGSYLVDTINDRVQRERHIVCNALQAEATAHAYSIYVPERKDPETRH